MIVNIEPHNFGGPMRNGDLIGLLNYLAYLHTQPPLYRDVVFHVPDRSIQPNDYIVRFRDWLIHNTKYLTSTPGEHSIDAMNINLWDLRSMTGDVLELNFNKEMKKKICIFPLLDGPYNLYRNWSIEMTNDIINHYSQPQYDDYEKVLGIHQHNDKINCQKFITSTDFIENIEHIIECSHFVGGDTGTSHFASVLPKKERLNYYYGSIGLLHTTPFYALQGKGNINMFTNKWKINLL